MFVNSTLSKPSVAPRRDWIRLACETYRLWIDRIEGRRQLAQMSYRELRDIGVTRSEAINEVNKPFWR